MKIIFLDIDGVLNHQDFYEGRYNKRKNGEPIPNHPYSEFCPDNVKILNKILNETGAEIVLSSTWRNNDNINQILRTVGVCKDIYDITPYCTSRVRGAEIDMYLHQHYNDNIENYVIIDDDNDMLLYQKEHFFKTNAYEDGLNEKVANQIINFLNKK